MIARCPQRSTLEAWAREGSGAELPADLREHALRCPPCRDLLDDIRQTRRVFEGLPDVRLESERVDAIRFAVMAETRKADAARPPAARRRLMTWSLAAAALVLAAVVGWSAIRSPTEPPANEFTAAVVQLAPGAVGDRLQHGPDEVFLLEDGRAEFTVRKLTPDERFRVIAGRDSVEVRGTRFTVEVEQRRLMRVSVAEGRVVARVDGAQVAELGSGESWTRPALAHPASPPDREALPVAATGSVSPEPAGRVAGPTAVSSARAAAEPRARVEHRDAAFRRAWRALQAGRSREAAVAFDVLLQQPDLDPGRRADLLYWSARAHQQSGDTVAAQSRAESLVEHSPQAWHASDAALLMGESLLEQGNPDAARRWLDQALRSDREAVRIRARELLGRP